jgi:hypothetical protein
MSDEEAEVLKKDGAPDALIDEIREAAKKYGMKIIIAGDPGDRQIICGVTIDGKEHASTSLVERRGDMHRAVRRFLGRVSMTA